MFISINFVNYKGIQHRGKIKFHIKYLKMPTYIVMKFDEVQ